MLATFGERKWISWAVAIVLFVLALTSRLWFAYSYPVDGPGDGVVYAQLAKNILEQHVFSVESQAPFAPTLVRLPGYPLFIAAVYTVFGHDNNTALRIVQAVFDTGTCVIVAMLAFLWTGDEERKSKNALWAFLLAVVCPFIAVYSATILTETLTTFLMAAMMLTATLGFRAMRAVRALLWWVFTGSLAAAAVLLRPDSGLFAGGIGLTLVISGLFLDTASGSRFIERLRPVIWKGAAFSLAFMLVLAPWTIRNYQVFGVFQPLAPAHAEMPGEFVPHGYDRWLRTWVDDSRFIEPMLWNLDEKPIRLSAVPERDFDSPEERERVAALLDRYNRPPGFEDQYKSAAKDDETDAADEGDSGDDNNDDSADDSADSGDDRSDDSADENSNDSNDDMPDEGDDEDGRKFVVKMTPEIDAGFADIADERIARSPIRYYLFLPVKRAASMWFDSHSLYYPFGGQMSPISDLDYDVDQQYWLPAFTVLTWLYTLLAIGGVVVLWRRRRNGNILRWLILLALMTLPRIIFFSTVENPEPRYVVELFVFTAILGGFLLGNFKLKRAETVETADPRPLPDRVVSLDVFRGLTIAAMVLVNEPGTWDAVYQPLAHAEWNGATPADWIFPFFLFIVGVSIAFALGKQTNTRKVHEKIFRRAFLLFGLGILLEIFPFYDLWTASWIDPSTLRIMGVLQRIAICYLAAALIYLHTNWKQQLGIAVVILLGYWALLTLVDVPGCLATIVNDKACNLAAYVDQAILGVNHIWNQSKVLDPEGLLSTLPAIGTTLAGVLTGQWLRSGRAGSQKLAGMLRSGVVLATVGWIWSFWFPLNKALWTSSFAVYTAGLAVSFLAVCYWIVDVKGYRKWATPFLIFGSNAIALFVGSTIVGKALDNAEVSAAGDRTMSLQEKIFNAGFLPLGDVYLASFLYAMSFVLISLALLWPLYRRKIFIKI